MSICDLQNVVGSAMGCVEKVSIEKVEHFKYGNDHLVTLNIVLVD